MNVGSRSSQAPHHGYGARLRPTPCARSSARVEETSGAGAPSPPCGARTKGASSTRAIRWVWKHHGHTKGNACLSQTPVWWLWWWWWCGPVCIDDMFVHTSKRLAPNYGSRVPVDTTPRPAPVCKALKTHPISSSPRR